MAKDCQTIHLPVRFTLEARQSFREAYVNQPVPAGGYEIDFSATEFIDTAGLGMLLQLCEYAGKQELVRFVGLRPAMRQLLRMAELDSYVLCPAAGSQ